MRRQEAQSTRKTSLGSLDPIEKAVVAKFRANLSDLKAVVAELGADLSDLKAVVAELRANLSDHIADSTKHITWGIPLPYGAKLWHFDGSLMSTDGTAPEPGAVATLRPNEGMFGGCVAVEVETENLHSANPTWWSSGEGLTITDLGPGDGRIWRQKIDANSPSENRFWVADIPVSASTQYTFSIYLKGDNIVSQVYLRDDSNGESVIAPIELTENWQRVSVTLTTSTTATKLTRASFLIPAGSVGTVYVGDWQIEPNPFPTSFTTGTRAAGVLKYGPSILNKTHGTIAVWFKLHNLNARYNALITTSTASSPGPRLLIMREYAGVSANKLRVWDGDGATEDILTSTTVLQKDVWYHFAFTWSPSGRRLYINGSLEASNARSGPIGGSELRIGCWAGGSDLLNGLIDELLVAPFAATPEQIAAWHNMGVPFWDPWVGQR